MAKKRRLEFSHVEFGMSGRLCACGEWIQAFGKDYSKRMERNWRQHRKTCHATTENEKTPRKHR